MKIMENTTEHGTVNIISIITLVIVVYEYAFTTKKLACQSSTPRNAIITLSLQLSVKGCFQYFNIHIIKKRYKRASWSIGVLYPRLARNVLNTPPRTMGIQTKH